MTGIEVLSKAFDICGLNNDEHEFTEDTKDLQTRGLTLLNITLAECSSLDCRIRKAEHKVLTVNTILDKLECSDIVANSVLPYGLARLLMLGEDDGLAADLNKLYLKAQETALSFGKAKVHSITEVYE